MRHHQLRAVPWEPSGEGLISDFVCYYFDRKHFAEPEFLYPSFGRFQNTNKYHDIYVRMQHCAFYEFLKRNAQRDNIIDCLYQAIEDRYILFHIRLREHDDICSIGGKRGHHHLDIEEATKVLERYQGKGNPPWAALQDCGFDETSLDWHHLWYAADELTAFNPRFARLARKAYAPGAEDESVFTSSQQFYPFSMEYVNLEKPGIWRVSEYDGYRVLCHLGDFQMPFQLCNFLALYHDFIERKGRNGWSDLKIVQQAGVKKWQTVIGILYASDAMPFILPPPTANFPPPHESVWTYLSQIAPVKCHSTFILTYLAAAGGTLLGRTTITPHILHTSGPGIGKSYAASRALDMLHGCFVRRSTHETPLSRFTQRQLADSSEYAASYYDEPPRWLMTGETDYKNALAKQALTETEMVYSSFKDKRVISCAFQPHIVCGNFSNLQRLDPALLDRFLTHEACVDGLEGPGANLDEARNMHLHAFLLSALVACGALAPPEKPAIQNVKWNARAESRFQSFYYGIHLLGEVLRIGGNMARIVDHYSADVDQRDLRDALRAMEQHTIGFAAVQEKLTKAVKVTLDEWTRLDQSILDGVLGDVKQTVLDELRDAGKLKVADGKWYVLSRWLVPTSAPEGDTAISIYSAVMAHLAQNYRKTTVPAEATNIQLIITEIADLFQTKLATKQLEDWALRMGYDVRGVTIPRIAKAIWVTRI